MQLQRNRRRRSGARGLARRAAPSLGVLLLAGLAGCGSSSSGSSDASGSAGDGPAVAAAAPGENGVARGVAGHDVLKSDAGSTVEGRAVIMTAHVSLESGSLTTVRAGLDRLLARYGGYVDKEDTVDDSRGRVKSSTLQVRVPSGSFQAVMDAFPTLATVTSTSTQAEDVTTEVIDVDARVRTAEVSLRRLRLFLGKATNVDSVIRLESEISQRESDLASLLAQQRYLKGQTSLATIDVSMTRTGSAVHHDPLAHAGFLTGLRNGWNAMLGVAVVAATVVGALLPFALVLALLLVPLILVLRARSASGWSARARSRSAAPAGPGPSTAAPRDRG
jgi:hypothetical protein